MKTEIKIKATSPENLYALYNDGVENLMEQTQAEIDYWTKEFAADPYYYEDVEVEENLRYINRHGNQAN